MFTNDATRLPYLAGSISGLLFAAGSLPMVIKAARTKNLSSYSLGNLAISNLGNILYWIYVAELPFGPVWFLHFFNTAVTFLMFIFYFRYEKGCMMSGLRCSRTFKDCIAG